MKKVLKPLSDSIEEQDIVIVDDTPDNLRLLVGILKERGYKVRPAPSGARALATIQKEPPDLILLDIMMPEMDGYEVCRHLKADELTCDIPIVFLSALHEVVDKVKAFKAGGVDFLSKPFQVEEVLARVNTHLMMRTQQKALTLQNEELKEKNTLITEQAKELELLATRDCLTGLSNRRDFQEKARREEKRFKKSNRVFALEEKRLKRTTRFFALVMIDIDHFKNVNDTYGHECGDKVLVGVAQMLKKTLRCQDILTRWGGEEFICLLPETEIEGARNAAEKIRTTIAAHCYVCNGISVSITVTLGISVYDGSCSLEECLRHADDALYKGKKLGRNQTVASD